ncbi:MBOAT family O-acyltransferase [Microvirga puerhi]|uniref:Probable alginate O-acetylase AlgI n=1 Tax=Microvirga puerhi TaxID=2876078 RepID=A0ABS7VJU0_9HYPH|nr:MBOAT family O-acyltransferase [Microvirga puerhi]MBZ6075421.1 MBOAT family protein [Microvirga puerhi]
MLFNSFVFLFAFLPVALLTHWLVERFRPDWRLPALLLLSLFFYGYWDWRFAPLLIGSILVNWLIARAFIRSGRDVLIPLAIAANLIVLAIFKYFNFFADVAALIPGVTPPHYDIALPLGISFFTFHHIMYLTDLKAGKAPRFDLVRYGLYIAFFPQVLAGPLVRWSEIMHQFEERPYARPDAAERFARGLMLLVIGLAKKVFFGDQLAEYANPVYQAATAGHAISMGEAWQAALGFTFQVYFDFSGYTDMALGLALLFGIVLPQNFDSPYRAVSLQDFWRRWHMTLSRFLRDYLYIAMGGSRKGLAVQIGALTATMTLGGLWHGAGWTYLVWGLLHGVGLGANTLWRKAGYSMPKLLGWFFMFSFFVLSIIVFRAQSFEATWRIYEAMLGLGSGDAPMKWRAIVFGAAFAFIGPTAWTLVHKLPPRRWIALAFALLFVIVLFKIGDDVNYEFIYFQF